MRKMSQNAVKRLCTACTKAESSRGHSDLADKHGRGAATDAATAWRAWKEGREEGNGGILLLAVDFASFTFIPETGRTDLGRPGRVLLRCL